MDDSKWGYALSEHFPGHRDAAAAGAWAEVKQRLQLNQAVTGVVVARAPFGAWIDLGVGFPALLEIIRMEGLTPERYRAGDWCPVGSEVQVFVDGFRDDGHQIGLRQGGMGIAHVDRRVEVELRGWSATGHSE